MTRSSIDDDLKERLEAFVPSPASANVKSLAELPAVYERPYERWNSTEDGRSVDEIREFLAARSGAPLPDTVGQLLADVADRGARVHDRGLARLIECAEPALAVLIANDTRTRTHCMRAGERHLVVAAASEAAFRRALRELGYLLASGEARVTKGRPARTSDEPGPRAAQE